MTVTYRTLDSLAALAQVASQWNDLWQRSSVETPMARAEGLQLWYTHLTQPSRFRAVIVEDSGTWGAALPIVLDRRGPLKIAKMPWHPWSPGGALLADRSMPLEQLADGLIDGMRAMGASIGWFDEVTLNSPEWQAFREALTRRGWQSRVESRYGIGQVVVTASWDWYESHLSKNHRKNQRKALSKLEKQGSVEYVCLNRFENESWRDPFESFVKIEDASWKGEAGSSLARNPEAQRFFVAMAQTFAGIDSLEMLQLKHADQPIAAEIGYASKGTYFSHKVGYDPAFAEYSPGNLLMYLQLQEYHQSGSHQKLDAISAMGPTMARWANQVEMRHRLLASLSGTIGNQLTGAVELALKGIRKLKKTQPWTLPELPAVASLTEMLTQSHSS